MKKLGFMADALEELADISLELQKADITLSSATKLITKQVVVILQEKTLSHSTTWKLVKL